MFGKASLWERGLNWAFKADKMNKQENYGPRLPDGRPVNTVCLGASKVVDGGT